jgi:hypothetical protein
VATCVIDTTQVYLPHHTGYAGGLSVEQELEMPFSATPTTELMFHVAPFFPTATDDPQQVHKVSACMSAVDHERALFVAVEWC